MFGAKKYQQSLCGFNFFLFSPVNSLKSLSVRQHAQLVLLGRWVNLELKGLQDPWEKEVPQEGLDRQVKEASKGFPDYPATL